MNHLCVSHCEAIKTLAQKGWSRRRIARELGIHRETVTRYLGAAKPAIVPPGAELSADSKPAIPTAGSAGAVDSVQTPKPALAATGSVAGRRSQCELYRAAIEVAVEQGLSAQRIYQDLVSDHAFGGNYTSVKRLSAACDRSRSCPFAGGKVPQAKRRRWISAKAPGWWMRRAGGGGRICSEPF